MPPTLTKSDIVRAVRGLPEDATVEDAIEKLLFLSRVAEGLEQARRGETLPHDEVAREIADRLARRRAG